MSASGQSETDRAMKPGKAPLLLPPPSARLPHAIAAEVGGVTVPGLFLSCVVHAPFFAPTWSVNASQISWSTL